jgi:hypothetical protein
MMNSLFFAAVMGWYFIIVSMMILFRPDYIKSVVVEFLKHRGLFFVVAIMTVMLGLVLVVSHNVWVMGWPVLITLLCWLVLVNGLIRLFFADLVIEMAHGYIANRAVMQSFGVGFLILGCFLLFCAYYS